MKKTVATDLHHAARQLRRALPLAFAEFNLAARQLRRALPLAFAEFNLAMARATWQPYSVIEQLIQTRDRLRDDYRTSDEGIAHRLGVHKSQVHKQVSRHHRGELLDLLDKVEDAQERGDENQPPFLPDVEVENLDLEAQRRIESRHARYARRMQPPKRTIVKRLAERRDRLVSGRRRANHKPETKA